MSDVNHEPVSLPAGSYDAAELQKQLDTAAKASEERRAKILGEISAGATERDPRHTAGTKIVERTTEIAPGIEVTEKIQVNDPKAKPEETSTGATTATITNPDTASAASTKDR